MRPEARNWRQAEFAGSSHLARSGWLNKALGWRATMRDVVFWLLCGLVFTIPLLRAVTLASVGTLSRVAGLAVIAAAFPCLLLQNPRERLLDVHFLAFVFCGWVAASFFWTIDIPETQVHIFTAAQLLVMLLCIWEFTSTRAQYLSLLRAFTLGATVSCISVIWGLLTGVTSDAPRYSLATSGPNEVAFTLCLAIPTAWYLSFQAGSRRATVAWRCFVPFAVLGIVLTASRAALLIAAVAALIIPLSLDQLTRRARAWLLIGFLACLYVGWQVVPSGPVERLSTFGSEVQSGDLSGREELWAAGVELVGQRPLTGFGAGAARIAVERITGQLAGLHNTFLSLAADLGAPGLGLFLLILYAAGKRSLATNGLDRKFAAVLLATFVVGLVPRHWEYEKGTWLVIALLVGHAATAVSSRREAARTQTSQSGRPVYPRRESSSARARFGSP
jgi:O-antigen ligase